MPKPKKKVITDDKSIDQAEQKLGIKYPRIIRSFFLEVLKNTAGSWGGDDWPKTEKRRKKIELAASRKRKRTW